jgi:hypothetical protein
VPQDNLINPVSGIAAAVTTHTKKMETKQFIQFMRF